MHSNGAKNGKAGREERENEVRNDPSPLQRECYVARVPA